MARLANIDQHFPRLGSCLDGCPALRIVWNLLRRHDPLPFRISDIRHVFR